MLNLFLKIMCGLSLGWLLSTAQAAVYPLPPSDVDVIGQVRITHARRSDTLLDVARRYSLGYEEIIQANPGVDRWLPGEGTAIVLPTRFILPSTPRQGVVLNIPEMRLYYYPKEGKQVYTYPVSIGRMDWKTPQGKTSIIAKKVDPAWRPPASIKAEHAAEGDPLPDVVPAGPDNPLGRYAMRLGVPGYLIHSTNKPYGIGMRVTHGCVRMYPENIERLFGMVPVGTAVRIIDQPVKVGRLNGEIFIESHAPLEEDNSPTKITLEQAHRAVSQKVGADLYDVDQAALAIAVEKISGIPVSISRRSGRTPYTNTATNAARYQGRPAYSPPAPTSSHPATVNPQMPVYPPYPPNSRPATPGATAARRQTPPHTRPTPTVNRYPAPSPYPAQPANTTVRAQQAPRYPSTYHNLNQSRATAPQGQTPSRYPSTYDNLSRTRTQTAPTRTPLPASGRPQGTAVETTRPQTIYRHPAAPTYKPQASYPPAPAYNPPSSSTTRARHHLPPPPTGYPPVYRTTTAPPYPTSHSNAATSDPALPQER